jgi:hypothetical protein
MMTPDINLFLDTIRNVRTYAYTQDGMERRLYQ